MEGRYERFMLTIPQTLRNIYPNPVRNVAGTPAVVFRDHRWTLPILYLAGDQGLLKLPARVATFDRHRDSLEPVEARTFPWRFRNAGGLDELMELVTHGLSPRDDDWLLAGIEAGLISDVIRFGTDPDGMEGVVRYRDRFGFERRIFHLERPLAELSYKGALVDPGHQAAKAGLWEALGWDPSIPGMSRGRGGLILDIDLDFFTIAWELYTIPFTEEIYEGEFVTACQSSFSGTYRPVDFIRVLTEAAGIVTIACEPDFCGGKAKARKIIEDVDRILFRSELHATSIAVDYLPSYPSR